MTKLLLISQTIELAAEAIRGHKSAHSFATGPVIAEPAMAKVLSVIAQLLTHTKTLLDDA